MADILLIDDDAGVRNAIKRMLLQDGHVVRDAADGRDAMPLMRERAAEIVVSDVYMAEVDGIELLIRLHGAFPAARVVIMTGGGNMNAKDLLDIAKSLGARATLPKPISVDVLRAAIALCAAKG